MSSRSSKTPQPSGNFFASSTKKLKRSKSAKIPSSSSRSASGRASAAPHLASGYHSSSGSGGASARPRTASLVSPVPVYAQQKQYSPGPPIVRELSYESSASSSHGSGLAHLLPPGSGSPYRAQTLNPSAARSVEFVDLVERGASASAGRAGSALRYSVEFPPPIAYTGASPGIPEDPPSSRSSSASLPDDVDPQRPPVDRHASWPGAVHEKAGLGHGLQVVHADVQRRTRNRSPEQSASTQVQIMHAELQRYLAEQRLQDAGARERALEAEVARLRGELAAAADARRALEERHDARMQDVEERHARALAAAEERGALRVADAERYAAAREALLREAREHAERALERGVAAAKAEAREAIAKAEMSQDRAWMMLEQLQGAAAAAQAPAPAPAKAKRW